MRPAHESPAIGSLRLMASAQLSRIDSHKLLMVESDGARSQAESDESRRIVE
jgi:hypothetical protein